MGDRILQVQTDPASEYFYFIYYLSVPSKFMPPGPAFNWFCVLASTVDILSHAVQIRASQVACGSLAGSKRKRTHPLDDGPPVHEAAKGYQTNISMKRTSVQDVPKDHLPKDAPRVLSSRPEISRHPPPPKVELNVRRDVQLPEKTLNNYISPTVEPTVSEVRFISCLILSLS